MQIYLASVGQVLGKEGALFHKGFNLSLPKRVPILPKEGTHSAILPYKFNHSLNHNDKSRKNVSFLRQQMSLMKTSNLTTPKAFNYNETIIVVLK